MEASPTPRTTEPHTCCPSDPRSHRIPSTPGESPLTPLPEAGLAEAPLPFSNLSPSSRLMCPLETRAVTGTDPYTQSAHSWPARADGDTPRRSGRHLPTLHRPAAGARSPGCNAHMTSTPTGSQGTQRGQLRAGREHVTPRPAGKAGAETGKTQPVACLGGQLLSWAASWT